MGIAWYRKAKAKYINSPPEKITDKNNHERGRLKIRPKKKRFKKEEILSYLREVIQKYIDKETTDYNNKTKLERKHVNYLYTKFYFAEDFALELNVPCHIIEQCFATLNKEGLLHLPRHRHLHDGKRAGFYSGSNSDWIASKYYVRLPFSYFPTDKKHDLKRKLGKWLCFFQV